MYQTYGIRRDRGLIKPFVAGCAVAAVVVVGAGIVGSTLFHNPFATAAVDHSPAPILTEIRDLGEFHAAEARFEVIVDLEDDVHLVPQFIAGERVQYVAVGSVDALVDFSGIGGDSIRVDPETRAVTIALPAPRLENPVIDQEQSHVMNRDRGILNRLGGALVDSPTSEHDLVLAAQAKMAAAAASSDVAARAQESTATMLGTLLAPLGYDVVEVTFEVRNA